MARSVAQRTPKGWFVSDVPAIFFFGFSAMVDKSNRGFILEKTMRLSSVAFVQTSWSPASSLPVKPF